ncbi:MAG: recombinase family protein, partial [Oscillospiraceae bacterium]|nr:recombinase family protein [Oscillospiraceae bacterium]
MPYCLYVRKSRADVEAEAHGEGETLSRHITALLELAKRRKLDVTQIYREIVSGETIAARPVMQQLLSEVEQGAWDGVLVMEVERLARGDTIDQGIVAQTFKYSDTKIITPLKEYNPNDEFDEEYFEFGLFMSRREYKTINRRLQRGRLASVKEGKYVASRAPYGYERIRIEHDKGFTLRPVEAEVDIVRFIFQLYTTGEKQEDGSYHKLGMGAIAKRLNSMRIPAPNEAEHWQDGTI